MENLAKGLAAGLLLTLVPPACCGEGAQGALNTPQDLPTLNEALNDTNFVWSVSCDQAWVVEDWESYDGVAAVGTGNEIGATQGSLETTIAGPGTLSFWAENWPSGLNDYLQVLVNGEEHLAIKDAGSWQQYTFYLGEGTSALQWALIRTDPTSSEYSMAFLDQVSYSAGKTLPIFTQTPSSARVMMGDNVTLTAAAIGTPPLSYQWQLNGTNIQGATGTNLYLPNIQVANEGNYQMVASNPAGTNATAIATISVVDLGRALNNTNLVWTTGGNGGWFPQTTGTHDGSAALRSGAIGNSQQSTLQTSVVGPGTLDFWWWVSSEPTNDVLSFSVDAAEQLRISGAVDWQNKTIYVGAGTHTLTWTYAKNASLTNGADCARLDQVTFTPGATPPTLTLQPTNQVVSRGSNVTFAVAAFGTPPLAFQWSFNGAPLSGQTNATLTISRVQNTNAGAYLATISNGYGQTNCQMVSLDVANVLAWGAGKTYTPPLNNNYGQCQISNDVAGVAVAAGGYHSLVLQRNGKVKAYGFYDCGEACYFPSLSPNEVFTSISAGYDYSFALNTNGALFGSGILIGNSLLTAPANATNLVSIACGWYHCLALRSNGTVLALGAGTNLGAWPNVGQGIVPTNLTGIVALACGGYHSLALLSDRTVAAWGWNGARQTEVPAGLSDVVAIAAGASNSLALKIDGTVVAWGDNTYGQNNVPEGLTNVVAISCGGAHSLALKRDGTIVAWGLNASGQATVPAEATNIMAVAAGGFHSLALANVGPVTFFAPLRNYAAPRASDVIFSSPALGDPPVSYQWQLNGTNLPGATNYQVLLTNVTQSAAGDYQCIASNPFGAVTNSKATLSILPPSPRFGLPIAYSKRGFSAQLTQLPNDCSFIIEASTNLVEWVPILTNPPANGTFQFQDSQALALGRRFYRVLLQPPGAGGQ